MSILPVRYAIEQWTPGPAGDAWRRISEHIEREAAIGAAAVLAHARPDLYGPAGCRRLRVRAVPAPAPVRAVDDPVILARVARIVRGALRRNGGISLADLAARSDKADGGERR